MGPSPGFMHSHSGPKPAFPHWAASSTVATPMMPRRATAARIRTMSLKVSSRQYMRGPHGFWLAYPARVSQNTPEQDMNTADRAAAAEIMRDGDMKLIAAP